MIEETNIASQDQLRAETLDRLRKAETFYFFCRHEGAYDSAILGHGIEPSIFLVMAMVDLWEQLRPLLGSDVNILDALLFAVRESDRLLEERG